MTYESEPNDTLDSIEIDPAHANTFFERIGEIVVLSGQIDQAVSVLVGGLTMVGITGNAIPVLHTIPLVKKIQIIRALCKETALAPSIMHLADRVEKFNRFRDRVVHGSIGMSGKGAILRPLAFAHFTGSRVRANSIDLKQLDDASSS